MNEEHINKLKQILVKLNPLGEEAKFVEDLNDYETEAIDILFSIEKKDSRKKVEKIIREVLKQAFNIDLRKMDISEITDIVMTLKREYEE